MKNIFSLFFLHESCSENILGIGLSFVPVAGNNIWIVSVKEKKKTQHKFINLHCKHFSHVEGV